MPTLHDLTTGRDFQLDEHLEAEAEIPVLSGIQFQGDLAIIPLGELRGQVTADPAAAVPVGPEGAEVIKGTNGGHTHLLVADPGTATWNEAVTDTEGLAIGVVDCTAPVHILHAEHGGTGLAPGGYVLRRQREQADEERLVAD